MLSIAQRTVIGSAIEEAEAILPKNWKINVRIKQGEVGIELHSWSDLYISQICTLDKLPDQIRDVINTARELSDSEIARPLESTTLIGGVDD